MGRQALVLEAHYTTHIEGTRLTLDKPKFKKPLGDMTHICDLEERLSS